MKFPDGFNDPHMLETFHKIEVCLKPIPFSVLRLHDFEKLGLTLIGYQLRCGRAEIAEIEARARLQLFEEFGIWQLQDVALARHKEVAREQ